MATASFQAIIEDYDLFRKLNELDGFIDDAKRRKEEGEKETGEGEPVP